MSKRVNSGRRRSVSRKDCSASSSAPACRGSGRPLPVPADVLHFFSRGPVRLFNDNQQDRLVNWMAENASRSITSSSSQSPEKSAQCSASVAPESSTTSCSEMSQQNIGATAHTHPFSQELFQHTFLVESQEKTEEQQAEEHADIYPDAQSLELPVSESEKEEAVASLLSQNNEQCFAAPDDSQTQITEAGEFLHVASSPQRSQVNSEEEEGCFDDDIADPTWRDNTEHQASATSAEEEDAEVSMQARQRKRKRRSQESAVEPTPAMVGDGSRSSANTTSRRPKSRTCLAWDFFDIPADCSSDVICRICKQRFSRGKDVHNLNTTCMNRHMLKKHEIRWLTHHSKKVPSTGPVLTPTVSVTVTSPSTSNVPAAETLLPVPIVPMASMSTTSTPLSSQSQCSSQPSLSQLWERKKTFNPNHEKVKSLNVSIAKLLATEMLPFRLVDTEGFRHVMALACPQYNMPSRHFFSKKAVPALALHVANNIHNALGNSVCNKVHLTTDTWTSKHGQGRYISLTAHWVTLMAARAPSDGTEEVVLKSPRLAGQSSVWSTHSSDSSSSSGKPGIDHQRSYRTAHGKLNQAVLKLICLGERQHTGRELWTALQAQADHWLTPNNLTPGKVVCDNGSNLIAAIRIGKLTHIPCLAHVMNLVVQKFLKNYPGLEGVLKKTRALCSHFRRSHPASARLATLQRELGLPVNRLICDLPTRWNSTLYMLQRLWQQRNAIMQYVMSHGLTCSGVDLGVFTHREWTQIKELCTILDSFEVATKMVSAENALVSITIPVIHLMEQTLFGLRQEVPSDMEEDDSLQQSGRSSSGSFPEGSQCSGAGHDEDELEEEEDSEVDTTGGRENDLPAVVRGWPTEEEEQEEEEDPFSAPRPRGLGEPGSMSHMSAVMLHYLQQDPRIKSIKINEDYWVATLLDPRYKMKVGNFLTATERDSRMVDFETALIDQLQTSFPATRLSSRQEQRSRQEQYGSVGCSSRHQRGNSQCRTSRLTDVWQNFFGPSTLSQRHTGTETHRDRLQTMVREYLRLNIDLFGSGLALDPFDFWVSKIDEWPELSRHALEVLSCPAASVISERTFSTAGGVITDRRIRLSPESVDHLTVIKMNQNWISKKFVTPVSDVTD